MENEWIYSSTIMNNEIHLFNSAFTRHVDNYYYNPIAVAKQPEVNTRYRFLCVAYSNMNPGLPSHFTWIEIYRPKYGIPYITKLENTQFENLTF